MMDRQAIDFIQVANANHLFEQFTLTGLPKALAPRESAQFRIKTLVDDLWDNRTTDLVIVATMTKDDLLPIVQNLRRRFRCHDTDNSSSVHPTPVLVNEKKARLANYFRINPKAPFFIQSASTNSNSSSSSSSSSRSPNARSREVVGNRSCDVVQFHHWETGLPINSTNGTFTLQQHYSDLSVYVHEAKQLHAVIDLLLKERCKPTEDQRNVTLFMQDFYAFLSPVYTAVIDMHRAILPHLHVTHFDGAALLEKLYSNVSLANDSDSDTDTDTVVPATLNFEDPLASMLAALLPGQDVIEQLRRLLLSEDMTTFSHRCVVNCPSFKTAVLRQFEKEIRLLFEHMLVSNGCSACMSQIDFYHQVYAPIQTIMGVLQWTPFVGHQNYLGKNHEEYKKILAQIKSRHGGLALGEGTYIPLNEVVDEQVRRTGVYALQRARSRGYFGKILPGVFAFDAAACKHSTSLVHTDASRGKQQHTIISFALCCNGYLSYHGRALMNVGIYVGNDHNPQLQYHMEPHISALQKYIDQDLKIWIEDVNMDSDDSDEDNTHGEYFGLDIYYNIDMCAEMSLKNTPSGCWLPWNTLKDWVYKTQCNEGNFLVALPCVVNEAALKPLFDIADAQLNDGDEDGEEKATTIELDQWGMEYRRPFVPFAALDKCVQEPMHACTTCDKYILQRIFAVAMPLKRDHAITQVVLDCTGYKVTACYGDNGHGKTRVMLKGGLTSGAYTVIVNGFYNELMDALWGDHCSEEFVLLSKTMMRNCVLNQAFVLLPHPEEWQSYLQSIQTYVAREDLWQGLWAIIMGPWFNSPTQHSRRWHIPKFIDIFCKYKLNLGEGMDGGKTEERHKLYHYIRRMVRHLGSEMTTTELDSIMCHMGLEDFIKFERAGGVNGYRDTKARTHIEKITKQRRPTALNGELFEQRMYREEKQHFASVIERQGVNSTLDVSKDDFIRKISTDWNPGMNVGDTPLEATMGGGGGGGDAGEEEEVGAMVDSGKCIATIFLFLVIFIDR